MGERPVGTPLADLTSKIRSGATPRGGKNVYTSQGVAFIRSQNVYDSWFDVSGLARLDDIAAEALRGVTVEDGDVLLNITGDSVARCCLVPAGLTPARVSQHVMIIRPIPDQLDSQYLQALLVAPRMKRHLLTIAGAGATRPALTKEQVSDLRLDLPPIGRQRAVARVLAAIGKKIAANYEKTVLVEALLRARFIEFYESGNGWRDGVLGDCVDFMLGGDWGAAEYAADHPEPALCIRGADIVDLRSGGSGKMPTRYLKLTSLEKRSLRDGDLVVEISGGSPTQSTGRSVVVTKGLLELMDTALICSNFCRMIRPREPRMSKFLYLWLRDLYEHDEFLPFENGTTGIKNLDFATFSATYPLRIPPAPVLQGFDVEVAPLFRELNVIARESRVLTALRDVLLPALLTGEVQVEETPNLSMDSG